MNFKISIEFIILLVLTNYGNSLRVFPKIGEVLHINVCGAIYNITKPVSPVVGNVTGGLGNIVKTLTDLSNPATLLNLSIQTLEGLPLQVVLELLSTVCGTLMSTGLYEALVTPDLNKLKFVLVKPNNNYSFPLTDAEQMWNSPEFDKSKKIVIFATGWLTNINDSSTIDLMKNAYFCRNETNFVVVDSGKYLDTLYTWAAYNTEAVGQDMAIGLAQLAKFISVDKMHLIGHSLGAHIVGSAGRRFRELTGESISRITGLDPANPCFKNGYRLNGIQSTDATFVDIIHTDEGILGKRDPMGAIDSYAGGLQSIANGTLSFITSHLRAVDYYAESVYPGNGNNFIATKCSSVSALQIGDCTGSTVPVGYSTPNSSQGIYIFDVNGSSPFGKSNSAANTIANLNCTQKNQTMS